MKRMFDITVPVDQDLCTWPGDPGVKLQRVSSIEDGDNANVTSMAMGVHTGTHIDAPCHFIPGGKTVDQIGLEVLVGEVQVVEFGDDVAVIDAITLESARIQAGTQRVLFKTRNSSYWKTERSQFQQDFVSILPDAARWLVEKNVLLIGIDYLSVAPFGDSTTTHRILLGEEIVLLEGLDLSEVSSGLYTLYCLPMNLQGVDGAPARVILVSEE